MITDIKTICPNPGCDKDIELKAGKIRRAIMRKNETGNRALIGCPVCARVMIIPDEVSSEELFDVYISNVNSGYMQGVLGCVPWLENTQAILPNGHITQAGETLYKAGDGSKPLNKYEYMLKFGIDPEIAEYKTKRKSFKIGGVIKIT